MTPDARLALHERSLRSYARLWARMHTLYGAEQMFRLAEAVHEDLTRAFGPARIGLHRAPETAPWSDVWKEYPATSRQQRAAYLYPLCLDPDCIIRCCECDEDHERAFGCVLCLEPVCVACVAAEQHACSSDEDGVVLETIGVELKVTRERARQVVLQALRTMRKTLRRQWAAPQPRPAVRRSEPAAKSASPWSATSALPLAARKAAARFVARNPRQDAELALLKTLWSERPHERPQLVLEALRRRDGQSWVPDLAFDLGAPRWVVKRLVLKLADANQLEYQYGGLIQSLEQPSSRKMGATHPALRNASTRQGAPMLTPPCTDRYGRRCAVGSAVYFSHAGRLVEGTITSYDEDNPGRLTVVGYGGQRFAVTNDDVEVVDILAGVS